MSEGIFIFYQIAHISLIVLGVVLAFRFIRALEKAAEAMGKIAEKKKNESSQ